MDKEDLMVKPFPSVGAKASQHPEKVNQLTVENADQESKEFKENVEIAQESGDRDTKVKTEV